MAVFSIHVKNEPASWLEKTSFRLSQRTNGRANQKAKVELRLGTVFVEETKIHQIGISVNTANRAHNSVTMLTVRRRTPYNRSGTTSFARRILRRDWRLVPGVVRAAVLIPRLLSGVARTRTPLK